MGAADVILLLLLAMADVCLVVTLHRRRAQRLRSERMMRSLSAAIRREIGQPVAIARPKWSMVLQRAS
jgi:hypothetical protein